MRTRDAGSSSQSFFLLDSGETEAGVRGVLEKRHRDSGSAGIDADVLYNSLMEHIVDLALCLALRTDLPFCTYEHPSLAMTRAPHHT